MPPGMGIVYILSQPDQVKVKVEVKVKMENNLIQSIKKYIYS